MSSTVQLFHPLGPIAHLWIPDDPKDALAHVVKCIEAGWLARAPGCEDGEQREDVGCIVRGQSGGKRPAPYVLLYSATGANSFAFCKVYLDSPRDVAAFEYAAKMKLADLPEYPGDNKPERGKSRSTDQYIIEVKPFGVIYKHNPEYSEAEAAAAKQSQGVYKTAKRLFVRWVDQIPSDNGHAAPTKPATPTQQQQVKPTSPTQQAHAPRPSPDPALDVKHRQVVNAYVHATTEDNVEQWSKWAAQFPFSPGQVEEQLVAQHAAKTRLSKGSMPASNGRTAVARA